MKIPFVGPTYELSGSFDNQRCVGWYPIESETGTAKEVTALFPTPGLRLYADVGDGGPIRNVHTTDRDRCFLVSSNKFYEVNGENTTTELGTLLTQSGYVGMASNSHEVLIVDGYYGYIFNTGTSKFERITSTGFEGGTEAVYLDQYFIVLKPRSAEFAISGLNDGLTWDILEFTTAESSPDDLTSIIADSGYLYVIGSASIEVYQNTGNIAFPFERIPGARLEIGDPAGRTAKKFNGGIVCLATDKDGMRSVSYVSRGNQPQRISTDAIDKKLMEAEDLSGSSAYVYEQMGHEFYCLQAQGLSTTLCFDARTGQWHERVALVDGKERRHPVGFHTFFKNRNIVADISLGNIYEYDLNTNTDNGAEILRLRRAPVIANEMTRLNHAELHVDFKPGVGITTGQGSDPQAMLRYSNDGGFTWSDERWTTIGKKGVYANLARWRRLGMSRNRVYELRVTDPVYRQVNGAYLRVSGGQG